MVDLFLVRIGLVVRLADALCDDFRVAFCVAGVLTVCALHSSRVLKEVTTKRTAHNVVELLLDKFVALLFVNFFLLLSNSSLSVET